MRATPPATLHFFCGKAGAGKSTLSQRLAGQHGALLLSEDVWLSRLYGHVLHWLQTPDALCLQRIARRNVERPEGSSAL